jgi:hypothetical protein
VHSVFFWQFHPISQSMVFNNFSNGNRSKIFICELFARSLLINMFDGYQDLVSHFKVFVYSLFIVPMAITLIGFLQKMN